jgi:hypothetical protein
VFSIQNLITLFNAAENSLGMSHHQPRAAFTVWMEAGINADHDVKKADPRGAIFSYKSPIAIICMS